MVIFQFAMWKHVVNPILNMMIITNPNIVILANDDQKHREFGWAEVFERQIW